MLRISLLVTSVLVMACAMLGTPAHAQASRTWVSGIGDDANPCSRTAPCKTFAGAISKTAAGGEINALDPAGFGGVTITKSITISSESLEAGALVAGTNGIVVNAATTDTVVLRGLDIEGLGTGLAGVNFVNGGALQIERCVIRDFRGGTAAGINFAPPTGTTAKLSVIDTIISHNGNSVNNGGILIKPTGTGVASAHFERVHIFGNSTGLLFDGTAGTGSIRGSIRDSAVIGNANNGITVQSNGTGIAMMVDRVASMGNVGGGLVAVGSNAGMLVSGSTITQNGIGVAMAGAGTIFSYKNNNLNGNLSGDGAFTSTLVQQ